MFSIGNNKKFNWPQKSKLGETDFFPNWEFSHAIASSKVFNIKLKIDCLSQAAMTKEPQDVTLYIVM